MLTNQVEERDCYNRLLDLTFSSRYGTISTLSVVFNRALYPIIEETDEGVIERVAHQRAG